MPSRVDPRWLQILALSGLLAYGTCVLQLDVSCIGAVSTISAALLAQVTWEHVTKTPTSGWRSALISSLSLCLLLRSNSIWFCVLAALITISSKFVLRNGTKHIFNPTNFGIGVLLLAGAPVWISPGQWGSIVFTAAALIVAGALVSRRADRLDSAAAFLATYATLLFARAWRLGDPLTIPLHQLESGALLIFTFFMISDPRSTPNHRVARWIFSAAVACLAYYHRFTLYDPNGLIVSLLIVSPVVPLLDWLIPARGFSWEESRDGVRCTA